jgi:site-specific DNA-methyltransferase (adenine-specific)
VTPVGGIVLDPFTGSGSTGKAAILENCKFIGIEMTGEYLPIIVGRIVSAEKSL